MISPLYQADQSQTRTWNLSNEEGLDLYADDWTVGEQLQWDFIHDAHHDVIFEVLLFQKAKRKFAPNFFARPCRLYTLGSWSVGMILMVKRFS